MSNKRAFNPFAITKAVDLNDLQIENFWVAITAEDDEEAAAEFERPSSPMPTYILGAKGSGKTHLMRHQAFELQSLRHANNQVDIRDGVRADGYLGIYARCSGLQAGRFSGKRQTDEVWGEVFSYYFELWLSHHLLRVCENLDPDREAGAEAKFVAAVLRLFDRPPLLADQTIAALIESVENLQKLLDFEVNNCLLRGKLSVEITATRGKLIFGIPALLAHHYDFLNNTLFSFDIDEFENLTLPQQIHVNTLLREREAPTTFRIGARTYGVKTHRTNSAGEENIRHSEFQELQLDREYRSRKKQYGEFVRSLIGKRLEGIGHSVDDLDRQFEVFNSDWDNQAWIEIVKNEPSPCRPHFSNFMKSLDRLNVGRKTKDLIIERIVCPSFPLIEKLNILLMYQDIARGKDLSESADRISHEFNSFLGADKLGSARYRQAMQHYKDDLSAQVLRENGKPQHYSGVDTFITMSSGIPRALLTVLRSTYEWADFHGDRPFEGGVIKHESQRKGVLEAANWYYHSMRKAGDDGLQIQAAVDRLANIMRINRFSDKPVEVSLSTFTLNESDLDTEARRILKLTEDRAFIHRIPGGQRDRNSEEIDSKFQISPMLAPRWDLPLVRRGAIPLNAAEANAIFCSGYRESYDSLVRSFNSRVNFPFKGAPEGSENQLGLFE